MNMKTSTAVLVVALTALAACSDSGSAPGSAPKPSAAGPLGPQPGLSAPPGCVSVRMSESAIYDETTGNFNTVGIAVIGNQAPRAFSSVVYTLDANWDRLLAGKNFKATQREEFTFQGGDQLFVEGPTMSVPLSAPGMYEASGGSSKFVGGTGEFAGAQGSAFVRGVTMFAPGVAATSIAWYTGELCR